jgi:hypothetical protein
MAVAAFFIAHLVSEKTYHEHGSWEKCYLRQKGNRICRGKRGQIRPDIELNDASGKFDTLDRTESWIAVDITAANSQVTNFAIIGANQYAERIPMALEIQQSILCDICSNVHRGVKLPGKKICLDCAADDPELVVQIVRHVMPEMARRLEEKIKEAGIKWRAEKSWFSPQRL